MNGIPIKRAVRQMVLGMAACLAFGCKVASQDDNTSLVDDSTAEPLDGAGPILGEWTQTVGSCSYTHSFNDQGDYDVSSTTGEQLRTRFELYEPSSDSDRWLLAFEVLSDNNVVDCEGDRIDETGNQVSAYLGFPDDNHVEVFASDKQRTPRMTWTRQ